MAESLPDRLLVAGYWSQRKASRSECAARLSEFMRRIASENSLLADWYKQGRSPKQALAHRIALDAATLEPLLRTNNRDTDKSPILELGWSFSAWNGNLDQSASVMVHCGCYSQRVGNSVVLHVPRQPVEQLPTLPEALAGILIEVWEPESAVLEALDGTRAERKVQN